MLFLILLYTTTKKCSACAILTTPQKHDAFSVQPKTKVIGEVGIGLTVIDVDSTVGFATNGTLTVTFNDNTVGILSYKPMEIT